MVRDPCVYTFPLAGPFTIDFTFPPSPLCFPCTSFTTPLAQHRAHDTFPAANQKGRPAFDENCRAVMISSADDIHHVCQCSLTTAMCGRT